MQQYLFSNLLSLTNRLKIVRTVNTFLHRNPVISLIFVLQIMAQRFLIHFLCFVALLGSLKAQKVGLVLSGGGASGLCHIGVMKALEENNIPVDYICGTSIGGLIGAYYAAGYSPAEIEKLVQSYFFQKVSRGEVPVKYEYLIKKNEGFAAWLSLKYDFTSNYIQNLPTNVINSTPIDYYLMETFAGVSNHFGNHFDSLLVPFRCVASDIENKQPLIFKNGDLPSAVRASMSYPFYLRPIVVDNHLLFDGGLYNNFPMDIMLRDFSPDVIIGSNVAEKTSRPDDDNLYLQLRTLMMSPTNFKPVCDNGLIIEPWADVSVFSFDNAQRLIDSGYAAAKRAIPELKRQIAKKTDAEQLNRKRRQFRSLQNPKELEFDQVEINGFNRKQMAFIQRSLFYRSKPFTLTQLRKRYFRLTSDDKIKSMYPVAVYNASTGKYTLKLNGKQEKPFYFEPGGIISNRPISEAFLGLQYNYLGRIGFSAYANGYVGKLYTGTYSRLRFDFPGRLPLFVEPSFSFSRWDYYSSSALFYDFLKPAYLIQEDKFGEIKLGMPVGNISQLTVAGGLTEWKNQYYQSDRFTKLDTADATYFDYWYAQANYKINTLNRKMYATEGTYLNARARYLQGQESYYPGNTSPDTIGFKNRNSTPWLQLKLTFDNYFKPLHKFRLGLFMEAVYSTQSFFHNYQSTILSAPAFNPTPESQTFFIDAYRAHNYAAAGIKAISTPIKNFDLRAEAYIFQPVLSILKKKDGTAEYSSPFLYRHFSGMACVVFNSPVGPVSAGINYYDQYQNPFSFFFHVGYIIFNRKSID